MYDNYKLVILTCDSEKHDSNFFSHNKDSIFEVQSHSELLFQTSRGKILQYKYYPPPPSTVLFQLCTT